jgi:hypothetical protein
LTSSADINPAKSLTYLAGLGFGGRFWAETRFKYPPKNNAMQMSTWVFIVLKFMLRVMEKRLLLNIFKVSMNIHLFYA